MKQLQLEVERLREHLKQRTQRRSLRLLRPRVTPVAAVADVAPVSAGAVATMRNMPQPRQRRSETTPTMEVADLMQDSCAWLSRITDDFQNASTGRYRLLADGMTFDWTARMHTDRGGSIRLRF